MFCFGDMPSWLYGTLVIGLMAGIVGLAIVVGLILKKCGASDD